MRINTEMMKLLINEISKDTLGLLSLSLELLLLHMPDADAILFSYNFRTPAYANMIAHTVYK
jgi:hypothetical protein